MIPTYTDQLYAQFRRTSSQVKILGDRQFLDFGNMDWHALYGTRWVWLLDGMFYVTDDSRLVPAFARPVASAPSPSLPAGTKPVSIAALNALQAQVQALVSA